MTRPIALTIAGSDSSGGAGIQADLKTFSALGVYGASVITAITAQNTLGVEAVHAVPPDMIRRQMSAVFSDLDVGAVKTGMLGERSAVDAVVEGLARAKPAFLVVDPVMVATSGDLLIAPDAVELVRTALLPLADVVTPNLAEAARLLGEPLAASESDQEAQARRLLALGPKAVLLKGGHGEGPEAADILALAGTTARLAMARIETKNTHGTGCTLSAAIAAFLARGEALEAAVRRAKDFVWQAIAAGRSLEIGRGNGPVDHLHALKSS